MKKGKDYVIVMRDFNVIAGEDEQGKEIGSYRLGKRNERDDLLVQFWQTNKLFVTNTWFKTQR